MSRFRRWWRNENYDQEHMRRFREAHDDWDGVPDHVVARSMSFARFMVGEALRDVDRTLRAEYPIIDRMFPPAEDEE